MSFYLTKAELHLFRQSILLLILGLLPLTFFQCTPKTTPVSLPLEFADTFSMSGEHQIPDRWWTTFGDEKLNLLIDTALDSNFDVLIAWQRLQEARAVVDRESSFLYPDLSATAQSGISFPQPDFVGGENVRLGVSADYEVDLWGRIRSRVEAEEYRAAASLADHQTAVITLSAEISRNWFLLAEARQQMQIVQEQIETNEKIIESLKNRFGSGQVRSVDILRQQQLLQSTLRQRQTLRNRTALLEHQLSVLSGISPQQDLLYIPDSLPQIPELPSTGIPGELIERRPDIRAAYLRLQATDRDLATAISNKYPRLSLSASSSLRANNLDALWESWAYSFTANLFAPLFYWGRIQAEVDIAKAIRHQSLYAYGQTVLIAFREVEDALIQEQNQKERIAILQEQLLLAEQSYEQLRVAYFNGDSDYLDVLTALDQLQVLRRDLVTARQTLLDFRIGLYRALAGSIGEDQ